MSVGMLCRMDLASHQGLPCLASHSMKWFKSFKYVALGSGTALGTILAGLYMATHETVTVLFTSGAVPLLMSDWAFLIGMSCFGVGCLLFFALWGLELFLQRRMA